MEEILKKYEMELEFLSNKEYMIYIKNSNLTDDFEYLSDMVRILYLEIRKFNGTSSITKIFYNEIINEFKNNIQSEKNKKIFNFMERKNKKIDKILELLETLKNFLEKNNIKIKNNVLYYNFLNIKIEYKTPEKFLEDLKNKKTRYFKKQGKEILYFEFSNNNYSVYKVTKGKKIDNNTIYEIMPDDYKITDDKNLVFYTMFEFLFKENKDFNQITEIINLKTNENIELLNNYEHFCVLKTKIIDGKEIYQNVKGISKNNNEEILDFSFI